MHAHAPIITLVTVVALAYAAFIGSIVAQVL
jgi:hypothetical protein